MPITAGCLRHDFRVMLRYPDLPSGFYESHAPTWCYPVDRHGLSKSP